MLRSDYVGYWGQLPLIQFIDNIAIRSYTIIMSRSARIVIPDIPHHITQRGNYRQQVFFSDEDRLVYLRLLREMAERFGMTLLGYCLMTNHVHLLVVPLHERSLSQTIGQMHLRYTGMINTRMGKTGHLWQNRFFSCPLDDEYLWRALRYIEQNPVRAGLVSTAEDYPWSSARAHLGGIDETHMLDLSRWSAVWTPMEWREYLTLSVEPIETQQIRQATQAGNTLGSPAFLDQLEQRFGRSFHRRPVGRPKKNREDK